MVGDRFAIAGFFRHRAPLGVDYYRIKDLDAPFGRCCKKAHRCHGPPQRSTTHGGGYPPRHRPTFTGAGPGAADNDPGRRIPQRLGLQKGPYAVEDTRRARDGGPAPPPSTSRPSTVNVSDQPAARSALRQHPSHAASAMSRDLPDKVGEGIQCADPALAYMSIQKRHIAAQTGVLAFFAILGRSAATPCGFKLAAGLGLKPQSTISEWDTRIKRSTFETFRRHLKLGTVYGGKF